MKPGKIVAALLAAIIGLIAVGLLVAGGGMLWAHSTQRDADGFLESPSYGIESSGYAVVTPSVDLGSHAGEWWPSDTADIRLTVTAPGDQQLFVGIGPSAAVDTYLGSVARDQVQEIGLSSVLKYDTFAGGAPATPPAEQDFWVEYAEGAGTQTITWDLTAGEWSAVMMNADASAGVAMNTVVAGRIPFLLPVGIGALIVGLVLGIAAAALLVTAIAPSPRGEAAAPAPAAAPVGTYPLTIEGDLQPGLSRWLWLVKWFLAIPHFIVLAVLFVIFALLTVVAGFAILFTGRYPRNIFDFNVGVLRWGWRVSFYTYSALGTDEYPPFTLQDVDYPARLNVAYPERLSRGLVLVKWWLLALPHYLVVGLFTSGLVWWTTDIGNGDRILELGGGLIGLLVFIAGLALLFTAKYPQGLFDLIMGMNRWVYRVAAYASLMRDEYPPFRFDLGGREVGPSQLPIDNPPPEGAGIR